MNIFNKLGRRLNLIEPVIEIKNVKPGEGFLCEHLPRVFKPSAVDTTVVSVRAKALAGLGAKPIWTGYQDVKDYPADTTGSRTPEQVRTTGDMGALFMWLVSRKKPKVIVEFGTAFGVSGMYWLAGLNLTGGGRLMTYEPNEIWAEIAEQNLSALSDRFTLTRGAFEDSARSTLTESSVDLAFIDAIHTSDFVNAQYDTLRPYLADGALVLFDDINFSADMRNCWRDIAVRADVVASYELGDRVGLAEIRH